MRKMRGDEKQEDAKLKEEREDKKCFIGSHGWDELWELWELWKLC